jgi:hypothetical protein
VFGDKIQLHSSWVFHKQTVENSTVREKPTESFRLRNAEDAAESLGTCSLSRQNGVFVSYQGSVGGTPTGAVETTALPKELLKIPMKSSHGSTESRPTTEPMIEK